MYRTFRKWQAFISNTIDSAELPKYLFLLPGGGLYFFASLMSELAIGIDLATDMNTGHSQGDASRASMFSMVISFPRTKKISNAFHGWCSNHPGPRVQTPWVEPSSLRWKCGGREKRTFEIVKSLRSSHLLPQHNLASSWLTSVIGSHTPEWREALLPRRCKEKKKKTQKAGLLLELREK